MKAYKLFRVKKSEPGKLFPLYVLADEPLLVKLLEKYRDDGISVYGTQTDVIDDLRDNLIWWHKEGKL